MNDDPYDYSYLIDLDSDELLRELATAHGELARLHEEIAFIRAAEAVKDVAQKPQRINDEGHRDALIEKKFLIVRLLDVRREAVNVGNR